MIYLKLCRILRREIGVYIPLISDDHFRQMNDLGGAKQLHVQGGATVGVFCHLSPPFPIITFAMSTMLNQW
jgi:hypothetical protein